MYNNIQNHRLRYVDSEEKQALLLLFVFVFGYLKK